MRPSRLLYVIVAVTMVAGWVLTSAPAAQAGIWCGAGSAGKPAAAPPFLILSLARRRVHISCWEARVAWKRWEFWRRPLLRTATKTRNRLLIPYERLQGAPKTAEESRGPG